MFGNEAEAEAYASAQGLPDPKNLTAVAQAIASSTKTNPSRPRVVVITHGAEPTVVVSSEDVENPKVVMSRRIPVLC